MKVQKNRLLSGRSPGFPGTVAFPFQLEQWLGLTAPDSVSKNRYWDYSGRSAPDFNRYSLAPENQRLKINYKQTPLQCIHPENADISDLLPTPWYKNRNGGNDSLHTPLYPSKHWWLISGKWLATCRWGGWRVCPSLSVYTIRNIQGEMVGKKRLSEFGIKKAVHLKGSPKRNLHAIWGYYCRLMFFPVRKKITWRI